MTMKQLRKTGSLRFWMWRARLLPPSYSDQCKRCTAKVLQNGWKKGIFTRLTPFGSTEKFKQATPATSCWRAVALLLMGVVSTFRSDEVAVKTRNFSPIFTGQAGQLHSLLMQMCGEDRFLPSALRFPGFARGVFVLDRRMGICLQEMQASSNFAGTYFSPLPRQSTVSAPQSSFPFRLFIAIGHSYVASCMSV